ncbi:hypothetical protein ACFSO0_16685 [Brevibacillus sp. GCM10020057]|uniref:hypothetical protein n=1 Tax=Brevibacillus sp. GCM10020057 TaxID=3317327 RepID=UPI00362EFBCE
MNSADVFSQADYTARFEWGYEGVEQVGRDADRNEKIELRTQVPICYNGKAEGIRYVHTSDLSFSAAVLV